MGRRKRKTKYLFPRLNKRIEREKMYINKKNIRRDFWIGIIIIGIIVDSLLFAWLLSKLMRHENIAIGLILSLFSLAFLVIVYHRYFYEEK